MEDDAGTYAVLTDPSAVVPPVPRDGPPGSVRWLRANVARFSSGDEHARRRRLVLDDLAGIDVDLLRREAFERTVAMVGATRGEPFDVMAVLARPVPVGVLAEALGLPDIAAEIAADIAVVAKAYHPHVEPDEAAERALSRLIVVCGGTPDEVTAARIGLLIQACDATAGLIGNALLALLRGKFAGSVEELLAVVARVDPPVLTTRRVVRGELVVLRLTDGLAFGAGPKACPGRSPAFALAAGIVAALRGCRLVEREIPYELSPNLRMPAVLLMTAAGTVGPLC
ncbi:hypothetical protein [Amycolatopsis sp. H20-H5]|uniref:hypothetical protein n=1 Tax=Amycolatopsis sp. H20-H5 TaxID=3046309 RepID=UPI002DBDFDBF|nr:hypothetical protein [Amycolatopsis sp. H20-H5]MEC3975252.1 hypothetical protein [Amycolatopsis sp. H20-H5]